MPLVQGMQELVGLGEWVTAISREARAASNLTVGLSGGSRMPIDRRVTDHLAKSLAEELHLTHHDPRLLVVQLQCNALSRTQARQLDGLQRPPAITASPLGRWSTVAIPLPSGKNSISALAHVPRWLPAWKENFGVILFDLGPMNMVPSRAIGRLCDSCYVVLGPESCASSEWILQHLAWHERAGVQFCGTLLSTFTRAA